MNTLKNIQYEELINKAQKEHSLDKEEIITLLKADGANEYIFKSADNVRKKYVGDDIYLRGLIEFSNICKNNCCYCGIRRDNHKVRRYRLTEEQIVDLAKKAKDYGLCTVVLQSGEDLWFDTNRMCCLIEKIKKLDLAITLSIGEKTFDEYNAYFKAGADRYLLRIETTDKNLYHKLDPDMMWDNRKRCLDDLREIGYEVGSGIMVGLPEQSLESIADDIIFFNSLDKSVVNKIINKFINELSSRLNKKQITVKLTDTAIEKIAEDGFDSTYGARPLKRYIQANIENQIAYKIITSEIKEKDSIIIDYDGNEFTFISSK